jgi:hypothetical protein
MQHPRVNEDDPARLLGESVRGVLDGRATATVADQHKIPQVVVFDRVDQTVTNSREIDPDSINRNTLLATPKGGRENFMPHRTESRRHGVPAPTALPPAMHENELHPHSSDESEHRCAPIFTPHT